MKKKLILHLINRDIKFTEGYISFFENCLNDQYLHEFYTWDKPDYLPMEIDQNADVRYIKSAEYFFKSNEILEKLKACYKLIISGLFFDCKNIFLPNEIKEKMYIQFWGGDYARLKYDFTRLMGEGGIVDCHNMRKEVIPFIRGCAGIINLVEGEWKEFSKITGMKCRHFTAPMPVSPNGYGSSPDLNELGASPYIQHKEGVCRIIIGNSATPENKHESAMNRLLYLKDEEIEVYCPLSYGSPEYRNVVIKKGKELFGQKFIPIIDFISKKEWYRFLNEMDVGIYNNNRQQAMGNIWLMLELGKKVYLRKDTAMWNFFTSQGEKVYNVEDIRDIPISRLSEISPDVQMRNADNARKVIYNAQAAMEAWENVLGS